MFANVLYRKRNKRQPFRNNYRINYYTATKHIRFCFLYVVVCSADY